MQIMHVRQQESSATALDLQSWWNIHWVKVTLNLESKAISELILEQFTSKQVEIPELENQAGIVIYSSFLENELNSITELPKMK